MFDITSSIVLYKSDRVELRKAIDSFLRTSLNVRLYLVDNSPTDELKDIIHDTRVEYIFNNGNVGFGKANNVALRKVLGTSKYHLMLNPDISFPENTLETIKDFMDRNQEVGHVLPKILYPDGSLQRLCKLLPTPADLFLRRFMKSNVRDVNYYYEMHFADYNTTFEAPFLSGCFMFIRTEVFEQVGLFDEKMFLYWEDLDLSRRIHKGFKTVYYPEVFVYHEYKRGAHKNFNLMIVSIKSLIYYFNKWGWFERERRKINMKTMDSILKKKAASL